MATKNPRVVGYIQPDTHTKLQQYMQANNLSESKALDLILSEYFGVEVPRVAPSSTPDINSRIAEAIAPLVERLTALESTLVKVGESPVPQPMPILEDASPGSAEASIPIEALQISQKVYCALKRTQINTVADLLGEI
jgi:hypothetical protein